MSHENRYPGSRGWLIGEVAAVLDPKRAESDMLKPLNPAEPALTAYRAAQRASWLSQNSAYIAAKARDLQQAAEGWDRQTGSSAAVDQFNSFVASAAEADKRDAAEQNAKARSAGAARARKARIQMGAVLLKAAEGAADPYGAAAAWLYGSLPKGKLRSEKRNLERELERYIVQNFPEILRQLKHGGLEFLTMFTIMPMVLRTAGDARTAEALKKEIGQRSVPDTEDAIQARINNGRLFELALLSDQVSPDVDENVATAWFWAECQAVVKKLPPGSSVKLNPSSPLHFYHVAFGDLAGGA